MNPGNLNLKAKKKTKKQKNYTFPTKIFFKHEVNASKYFPLKQRNWKQGSNYLNPLEYKHYNKWDYCLFLQYLVF